MYNEVNKVKTKEEFLKFLEILAVDKKSNEETWANKTIEDYLLSMQSWIEDMDGYYENTNLEVPKNIDWNFIANILYAGKVYE